MSQPIDLYRFTQTQEQLEISITLPKTVGRKFATWDVKRDSINAKFGEHVVLQGKLYAPQIKDETTYTIDNGKPDSTVVVITIYKMNRNAPSWPVVISGSIGSQNGEYKPELMDINSKYYLAASESDLASSELRLQLFKETAKSGIANSFFHLGLIYFPDQLTLNQFVKTEPNIQESIANFQSFLKLRPHFSENYVYSNFFLGRLYKMEKDLESAKRHYLNAAEHHSSAMFELGSLFEEMGDKTNSLLWIEKAAGHQHLESIIKMIKHNAQTLYGIPEAKRWGSELIQLPVYQYRSLSAESQGFVRDLPNYLANREAELLGEHENLWKLAQAQENDVNQTETAWKTYTECAQNGYPKALLKVVSHLITKQDFDKATELSNKVDGFLNDKKWVEYWFPGDEGKNQKEYKSLKVTASLVAKKKKEAEDKWSAQKFLMGAGVCALAAAAVGLFIYVKKDE